MALHCLLCTAALPCWAERWLYTLHACLPAILLLKLLTHSIYANALVRFHLWTHPPAAESARTYDAVTMSAPSFFKLMFLWLKFLVTWLVARLFALLDGIDAPENMLRCVCNNYDISGFWRTWYASFNKWLIRYMYIPLGGQR